MEKLPPPFLERVIVKDLFGFKQIDWKINNQVSVLVGKNGSGKSTILRVIDCILNGKDKNLDIKKIAYAKVELSDGRSCEILKNRINETELANLRKMMSGLAVRLEAIDAEKEKKDLIKNAIEFINNANLQTLNSLPLEKELEPLIEVHSPEEIKKTLNVEYVSTFDMMIMSKQEYDSVSDDVYTQLDFEIKKEITTLTKKLLSLSHKSATELADGTKAFNRQRVKDVFSTNFEIVNKFSLCVNNFFSDNDKSFKINNDGSFLISQFEKPINLTSLSSGEKQLLLILIKIVNCADKDTIFILDEPEISLHLKWQEMLISEIQKLNDRCQLVIATHSPAVVMQGWMDCLVDVQEITTLSK
ncbi:ATP-binding protein [Aeromonas veronii]|uniref:AAA family ATPase n=1 Tax=Aeromonas TaxID=642 RepID=UPI0022EB53C7|nr:MULTISPECIES: ATP-binding protein [Aeromonas]KAJ8740391.1 ATP-binding protein [Aeromonas veronii]MDA3318385.1 ATP-binding protein [Aeromonas sp. PI_26]